MDYIQLINQAAFEVAKKHHHQHNDTTGDGPLPEIPHHSGLERTTDAGKRTLWVVFGIMAASSVIFFAMALRQQAKNRIFHHITFFITAAAAISYYGMATGVGASYVLAPGHHAVREILWARYADWAVTTPLLLLDLTLLAGLPGVDIVLIVLADLGMILTGLFAALDDHARTKWGFYTFSCLFFLYVVYSLVWTSRKTAYLRSDRVGKLYLGISVYTIVLWTIYPIIWALAEGTNYISADSEVLAYGVIDVLAKPVFGLALLIAHTSIAESNVVLPSVWTEPRGAAGGYGAIGGTPAHD